MTLDHDRVTAALAAYEVGGELGRGAWGVVLEGRHRQLDREVAIKQLPRAFGADPTVRARFAAEARLLASLDHPHIVPVFDYVESDGLCLLVMEKLSGGTVWSLFTASGVTAEAACALVLATCAGLHAAHRKGILHRDVKPENILFSGAGALKVTDFGIAKVVGGDDTMVTRSGEVLGTPAYMAPEQAQATELGPATDVYAAGVMLYELLSGRLPFAEDGDALSTLYRHVHEQPVPLAGVAPTVPPSICTVVMRALATRPEDRFTSAESFGVALAEAATAAWGPGWPASRGMVTVMGSAAIVAATERQSAALGGLVPAPVTVVGATAPPVRATITVRAVPVDADDVVLVPVREMVARPPFPTSSVAWAAGLVAATLLIGVVGLGSPSHGGDLRAGTVRVAGVDPTAGRAVHLDLARLVPVEGRLATGGPERVELSLSLAGIDLGSAKRVVPVDPDGSFRAALDLAGARYLAGGQVTGDLSLLAGDKAVASQTFAVRPTRPAFLTLPGLLAIGAVLFVAAYAESVLRTLRRGRRLRTGAAVMVVLGGALGPALSLLGGLAASKEPGIVTFVTAALVGGLAGLFAGRAGVAVGRFRRLAREGRRRAR